MKISREYKELMEYYNLPERFRAGDYAFYDDEDKILREFIESFYASAEKNGCVSLWDFAVFMDFLSVTRDADTQEMDLIITEAFIKSAKIRNRLEKEFAVTKERLFRVLDLFDSFSVTWWLGGGWGADVLQGKQTRAHRDADISFDADRTEEILAKLEKAGYEVETDWLPGRVELRHPDLGYLDLFPLMIGQGTVRQADPYGGLWEIPPDRFGAAEFEGRRIPCISPEP